jgi:opacity protein-like surface antigen
MKEKIPFLLAVGLIPFATRALGQDSSSHLYLTGDLGAAFQEELRVQGADRIDFHNGVRGDVALGYQANTWLAAELATGLIWNSGDKIGGVAFSSFGASFDLYQIPLMGNLVLSTPAWHGFRPYIGVGAGGVVSMLDFQRPLGDIRDTDFTRSYQAFGGLKYQISQRVELDVGYKFLQTDDHRWEENGVTLQTGGTTTHSVTASFTWKF